jgi:predicted O-methyltransferase YrrM
MIKALVRQLAFKVLRTGSSELAAMTDLFVPPYNYGIEWNSGLGDSLHVLYGIARSLRPEVIVEIGSARGRSTCGLALACRQNGHGKVYAIDPHGTNSWSEGGQMKTTEHFLRERLKRYELEPWCEVIRASSQEAARQWSRPIDMLFIDGDHTFEGVSNDFEAFRPWLSENALVIFHDTSWEHHKDHKYYRADIGVPAYLDKLQRAGFHSVTLPARPGLTILDPRPGGFQFVLPASASKAS